MPLGNTASVRKISEFQLSRELWEDFGKGLEKSKDYEDRVHKFADRIDCHDISFLAAMLIAESFNDDDRLISPQEKLRNPFKHFYYGVKRFVSFLRKHLFDVFISAVVILPVIGLGWWIYKNVSPFKSPQVVVSRPGGLPAFYRITPEDIRIENRLADSQTFNKLEDAVGRFTLKSVDNDAPLTGNFLIDDKFNSEAANKEVFSIPVKNESLNSSIQPVMKLELLFAGKAASSGSAVLTVDVLLLGIEKHEALTTLITAMTPEEIETVKKALGNSEVFVVQNAKPSSTPAGP